MTDASGGHTYPNVSALNQPYQISVMVNSVGGQALTIPATATVTASPATATATQPILPPRGAAAYVEGQTVSGVVAAFTDANVYATASNYAAAIVWGDGGSSSGTISYDPINQVFDVTGATHLFARGRYNLTTVVSQLG